MKIQYILILFFSIFNLSISAQGSYIVQEDTSLLKKIELNEIIINASKNDSKLRELPVSVTVMPIKLIEQTQAGSLNQLSALSPNFVMPDYGSKLTSPVYIRGIGSRINSPSVSLYVDFVPYFEKSAFEFDFFDVEKIEILRGPQGTLFGRNSMGGIINVITRSPLNYQGTNINLTASNYGNYKIHASHYSLISNKLGISFSANYLHSDGFYTNLYTNNKVDNLNSYGFRNRLAYKITDKFYIENIFSLENSQQGGYPYSIYDSTLKIASPINYNQYSSYDRLMLSNALNSKYSNQKLEVSNTFSFQYIDDIQKIDQDFTDAKLYFVEQNQIQKMYANELILRSKKNKRYNWLVGGFAFVQKSESGVGVDYYQNVLWYLKSYNTDVKGIAFFHQSNFKITKKLSLTAGLRYDYETSEMHYRYESIKNSLALPIVDTLYPSTKDEIFLPKIAVNYDFEAFSLFISYATGYKAGGFNTTFERPEHLTFKNETSYNYEFGGKTSFLENKIFADFAIFYTQLKNQQIYRTVPSGRGSYLDNAGVSENKGFEFSLQNKAIKGFEIMIAYGYTYSKIVEYVKDETINYNHQFTPYIPRYTFAFQALQTIKLPLKWIDKIKISAVYNRNGELYWDLNNKLKEEPYALLNAKISFVKQNFQLDFWGKNLLNSDYNAFMFEALNKIYTQRNKPLQFGANFAVKF